jgi:hypothetical protein
MMSQVKNFSKILLCGLLLLAASCKDKNAPTASTQVDDPQWVVTVENNLSLSMTMVVKVTVASEGTLAAFIGNACCGIGEPIEGGLYNLYISPASENGGDVQLRFYAPEKKRIYVATELFPFSNNGIKGSLTEPYTPLWVNE